jgi:hypothetical protein
MKMEATVLPKCQLTFTGLHGVGAQKLGLFTVTNVRSLERRIRKAKNVSMDIKETDFRARLDSTDRIQSLVGSNEQQ